MVSNLKGNTSMNATPKAGNQTAQMRLEDEDYQLANTCTVDVGSYTFTVNSYQPIGTSLSATDSFLPVITSRINHSLARQKPPVLPSPRKCHAATVQEGGRK